MSYGPATTAVSNQTYQSGGTLNQRDPIEKAINIHGLLDTQAKAIGEARELINQLEVRLQSVLRPVPRGADVSDPPTPQPMQISARLSDHTRGIYALCSRVNELMQQLEV